MICLLLCVWKSFSRIMRRWYISSSLVFASKLWKCAYQRAGPKGTKVSRCHLWHCGTMSVWLWNSVCLPNRLSAYMVGFPRITWNPGKLVVSAHQAIKCVTPTAEGTFTLYKTNS
jgi:hypothetical protein